MEFMKSGMLIETLNWRYACKKFDSAKKIDEKTWRDLEESLILTPSSYGLQPWKFLVVTDKSVMQKLTAVSWGQKQVEDCSHLVVFVIKEKMDESYVDEYLKSISEMRGAPVESLAGLKKMIMGDVVNGARGATPEWATRQGYIALGNFMTSCALLGVDTCPMEGIEPAKYDEILGLTGTGYKTICACPAGFRSSDDKYAQMKKVRFAHTQMIKKI